MCSSVILTANFFLLRMIEVLRSSKKQRLGVQSATGAFFINRMSALKKIEASKSTHLSSHTLEVAADMGLGCRKWSPAGIRFQEGIFSWHTSPVVTLEENQSPLDTSITIPPQVRIIRDRLS